MNAEEFHENGISGEASASNQEDRNANLNGIDQSKGAIPKSKSFLRNCSSIKKNIKVNNNIENIPTLNCEESGLFKLNGIAKSFSQMKINVTDSPESVRYYPALADKFDTGSSSENDESISDDGCIYTYKGDNVADLPSSFFNLELPMENNEAVNDIVINNREGNSSPEMDFLEMDFDPGPSGEVDSDSSTNSEIERPSNLPLDSTEETVPAPGSSDAGNNSLRIARESATPTKAISPMNPKSKANPTIKNSVKMPWSCSLSERTKTSKQLRVIKRHVHSLGELLSPKEVVSPDDFLSKCEKNDVEDHMIWTCRDACLKQIMQIGPSCCGATAVLNVLVALRMPIPPLDKIHEFVPTNLRANDSPLPEYLLSRSRAGCTHRELIIGLHRASEGRVYCRFFPMFPERVVNLARWLAFWIDRGAVPIATLNLQKCAGPVHDSWHHQMIFGVGPNGVYLTNPLDCVEPDQLWSQLTSESVLLVRRDDVLSRYNPTTNLMQLDKFKDTRWGTMNVLGQVVKIIRERRREFRLNSTISAHVQIPADYKSGITLAIDMNSPAFSLLQSCPELPLLSESGANAL